MSAEADRPLTLPAWLDRLSTLLSVPAPQVTPAEQAAILDLARIAAHASERVAAPITTYLLGLALAPLEPQERAKTLRELAARLEPDPDSLGRRSMSGA